MGKLKSVPSPDEQPTDQRATTTSFRIPVKMYEQVKAEAERQDRSMSQIYLQALVQYFGVFDAGSWETTDTSDFYEPSHFYTKSQDKQGHSSTLHTPIPKPLAGEMTALVESGQVPAYRSKGDIVRDAIYHRVKQIAQMIDNAELETAVNMAMLMSEEMQLIDQAKQAEELIDAVRTNAHMIYSQPNSTRRLKKFLAQRRELADSIPEAYRSDYLSAIEDFEKRIAKKSKPRRK